MDERGLVGWRQFAYQKEVGARDALTYAVLSWLQAFEHMEKVVLYCADVAGAFDRVKLERLVAKLEKKGVHPHLVRVLRSWLGERTANVAVGGALSKDLGVSDIVYQGTVLGPVLWNLFYADVKDACEATDFLEIVFADDLNAYKTAPAAACGG